MAPQQQQSTSSSGQNVHTLPLALRQSLARFVDEPLLLKVEETCQQGGLPDDAVAALEQLAIVAEHTGCCSTADEDALAAQVQEYHAEAERIQQQLDIIGVHEEHLSGPAVEALTQLSEVASVLGLSHATEASLAAAWALLVCEDIKVKGTQESLERELKQLKDMLALTQVAQQEAQQSLNGARDMLIHMQHEIMSSTGLKVRMAEFAQRVERYKRDVSHLSDQLHKAGYKPELVHHKLVHKSQDNDARAQELAALKARLAVFQDLPPSQLGAELRVRQVQEQLASVTARLQRGMANL